MFTFTLAPIYLLWQSNFIECGHAMHDLLSRTRYTNFHGWSSPPDFNEVPSTLFENWCWMEQTLGHMNRHYTTLDPAFLAQWHLENPGQPSPPQHFAKANISRLIDAKKHQLVQWYLGQMYCTALS